MVFSAESAMDVSEINLAWTIRLFKAWSRLDGIELENQYNKSECVGHVECAMN